MKNVHHYIAYCIKSNRPQIYIAYVYSTNTGMPNEVQIIVTNSSGEFLGQEISNPGKYVIGQSPQIWINDRLIDVDSISDIEKKKNALLDIDIKIDIEKILRTIIGTFKSTAIIKFEPNSRFHHLHGLTTGALEELYNSIKLALIEDDKTSDGMKKHYVREFPDWRAQSDEIERLLDNRNVMYDKIKW